MSTPDIPPKPAPKLAPARPRKRASAAYTHAYSRFVTVMKAGLALTAVAVVAALLLLSGTFDGPDELDITFSETDTRTDDLRMVRPRIADVDALGRPYMLTAAGAVQDTDNPAIIHLEDVAGDLEGEASSSWTAASARAGLLNTDEEWIDLETDVEVFTDDGFQFRGEKVRVHLDSGDIASDTPVFAQGPIGTAEGGGLRVTGSGDTITLINGAKIIIFDSGTGDGVAGLFEPEDE